MRDQNQQNYIYGETFRSEAPKPKAIAYEILAKHISTGTTDVELHDSLNDIYKALSGTEPEVVTALDSLEHEGALSREDNLILVVLITISSTLGPDLTFLRQAILNNSLQSGEASPALVGSGLNPAIIEYVQKIIDKLKK